MSTISWSSWAQDLSQVGAIYPFQGGEVLFVILGYIFWLGWHVIQLREEADEIRWEVEHNHRKENIRKAMERY